VGENTAMTRDVLDEDHRALRTTVLGVDIAVATAR
jgi:hypothetical protein